MAHAQYIRLIPEADTAVLFIHGILGTPDHFHFLLPLVPSNVSVWNLLLDGHGKDVKDFSRTSMKIWETQVAEAVDTLFEKHQKVYIAAHSLGTLLAIEQSIQKPIAGLFLLAVPLRLHIRFRVFSTSLKLYFTDVKSSDLYAYAAKSCCGITLQKNPLPYFGWIPRFLELFSKIKKTRFLLQQLTTPGMVFQSAKDELVSLHALKDLQENTHFQSSLLPHSTHYYYAEEDLILLRQHFTQWLS